jgi:TetR/AcrR family transcriptional regulator, transcriptional repressor of bet genes
VVPKLGMQEVRREQICKAASDVISSKGFDRTTIRDVADTAGVSTGTVNHYFANKLDLLVQTLIYTSDRFTGSMAKDVQSNSDGVSELHAYVMISLEQAYANSPGWRVWIAAMSEATRSERVEEVIQRRRQAVYLLLRDIFVRIRPELRGADDDLLATAREVEGLVSGLGLSMITGEHDLRLVQSHRAAVDFALARLNAIESPVPASA